MSNETIIDKYVTVIDEFDQQAVWNNQPLRAQSEGICLIKTQVPQAPGSISYSSDDGQTWQMAVGLHNGQKVIVY